MNNQTSQFHSTSFVVSVGCAHCVLPRRVELPLEEYQEGVRRVVRAYLPGADPGREIMVTRQGSEVRVRCQRRVENLECESADEHRVTFEKVLSIPAGTAPDDLAAEYADGFLFVSWPTDHSSTTTQNDRRRARRAAGAVDLKVHRVGVAD